MNLMVSQIISQICLILMVLLGCYFSTVKPTMSTILVAGVGICELLVSISSIPLRATTRIPRFPQGAGFFVPIAFPSTLLPRIVSADDGFMISRVRVGSMIDVEPVIIQMGIAFWVHFELSL